MCAGTVLLSEATAVLLPVQRTACQLAPLQGLSLQQHSEARYIGEITFGISKNLVSARMELQLPPAATLCK
jgi:hypothetical protein